MMRCPLCTNGRILVEGPRNTREIYRPDEAGRFERDQLTAICDCCGTVVGEGMHDPATGRYFVAITASPKGS